MKIKMFALYGVAFCLTLAFGTTAKGRIINIGGTPSRGHARPPLFVNTGPFKGPGAGPTANSVFYNPTQIRHAYGFDQLTADGTNQTIAIVDAYGSSTVQSDLDAFCSMFGLPSTQVQIENPQNSKHFNSGWGQETALDVEWAHAIAPGAKIVLVVAKSSRFSDLLGAVDYAVNTVHANVVSMSWGGSEFSGETSYDSHFNHPGVTFVASAGDSGEGVEWPAASPYVVGVGGTSLLLDQNNDRTSETAWSGSGGGISTYELAPSWQSAWSGLTYRGVPDVSYLADPNTGVEVIYNGSLAVFGGTSVGAPQWAALVALTQSSLSSADASLYSVAGSPDTIDGSNFYDVHSGNNGPDPDDYAIAGYDLVTGLGSPLAAGVVPALAGYSPSADFTLAISPSSATLPDSGGITNYTVTLTPLNGFSGDVTLIPGSLPNGLSQTLSSSTLSVSGSSPSSATLTVSVASGTSTGSYDLSVTGTSGSLTHIAAATLVVGSTATASTMTVSAIKYSTSGHNGSNLQVSLTVTNSQGNPVSNASVSITLMLNGSIYATASGSTGSNGQVTFVAHHAPSGTYSTVVNSVTASGLTWDGKYPTNSFPN